MIAAGEATKILERSVEPSDGRIKRPGEVILTFTFAKALVEDPGRFELCDGIIDQQIQTAIALR